MSSSKIRGFQTASVIFDGTLDKGPSGGSRDLRPCGRFLGTQGGLGRSLATGDSCRRLARRFFSYKVLRKIARRRLARAGLRNPKNVIRIPLKN